MVTKAAPAKRKKTADMAESPPKRVTRARAAKASEDTESKPKTTKVTTASAKVAASKKKAPATSTAKISRPKIRVQNEEDARTEETSEQPKPETTKTGKTRQKKEAIAEEDGVAVPKPRGRQPKGTALVEQPKPNTTKTRGRAKKATTAEPEEPRDEMNFVEQTSEPKPATTTTRGRRAGANPTSATTATKAKPAAGKKQVQFDEGQDKENILIVSTGPKKSAMKPTGMKAKPVRKPAAPRTTTRGKKANQTTTQESEDTQKEHLPLSPKKVNQVAKTASASSEDELSETRAAVLSKSPAKGQPSPARMGSGGSNLNSEQNALPPSPSKQMSSSVLASPARRPPQSPFKESMMKSPKKLNLGDSIARPVFSTSQAPSPVKASLLQESPRKAKLGDSTVHRLLPSSQTPFKSSLLQSPARRPTASPFKPLISASPAKSHAEPGNLQISPKKLALFSPSKPISSPLRAERSQGDVVKIHTITDEGRVAEQMKAQNFQSTTQCETAPSTAPVCDVVPDEEGDTAMHVSGEEKTENIESVEVDTKSATALPSVAAMNLRRVSLESQLSEDELASPDKRFAPTPLRKEFLLAQNDDTPTITTNGLALTPLADQLSGWTASSPKKQHPSRRQRGVFSLGGPLYDDYLKPMEVDIVRESPAKSSFFEDEMVVMDAAEQVLTPVKLVPEDQLLSMLQASMDSQASQEYGDENAVPVEAEMTIAQAEVNNRTLTCTPAKVFTPAKQNGHQPREVCTVSKVPLRPSAEDLPLKVPRQRSKSYGGALAVLDVASSAVSIVEANGYDENQLPELPATPNLSATFVPQTPSSGMRLDALTPGRTGRNGEVSSVLKGAVVYVDVHTTEGADASSIFIDLLTQMGARCVKQWNWNPRASLGDSLSSTASPQGASPSGTPSTSKIGITHVVFKDGGKRTLEKARLSDGVVSCVGVGWVLE